MSPRRLTDAQRLLHAATLGVAANASVAAITAARKALAKRHHPDVTGGDGAQLAAINAAADALLGHLQAPSQPQTAQARVLRDPDWNAAASKGCAILALRFAKEHLDRLRRHDPLARRLGLALRRPPALQLHVHHFDGLNIQDGVPNLFFSSRLEPGTNVFSHPTFVDGGTSVLTHRTDPSFFVSQDTCVGTRRFVIDPVSGLGRNARPYVGPGVFHFGPRAPRSIDIRTLDTIVTGDEAARLAAEARRLLDGWMPAKLQPVVARVAFPTARAAAWLGASVARLVRRVLPRRALRR